MGRLWWQNMVVVLKPALQTRQRKLTLREGFFEALTTPGVCMASPKFVLYTVTGLQAHIQAHTLSSLHRVADLFEESEAGITCG
jgi:hypothetical protein